MFSLRAASYVGAYVLFVVLLNGADASRSVGGGLSYANVEFSKHYRDYEKYGGDGKYHGKHLKHSKRYSKRDMYDGSGGFEDERIVGEAVNVSPYLGPHVPGQAERDELVVRDYHQNLTIALVVLGILVGLSCVPMCLILWCCITTGRRLRKLKLEKLEKELDFESSAALYGPSH